MNESLDQVVLRAVCLCAGVRVGVRVRVPAGALARACVRARVRARALSASARTWCVRMCVRLWCRFMIRQHRIIGLRQIRGDDPHLSAGNTISLYTVVHNDIPRVSRTSLIIPYNPL